MVGLSKYIKQGKDRLTRSVPEYAAGKAKYSLPKESNLIKQKYMRRETAAHNTKNQIRTSTENGKIEGLKLKPIHGQSNWDLERPSLDTEKSMAWVCSSGLMGEQSLITAAHDRALNTHYQQRNIMKQPTDSKCSMCY